MIRVIKSKKSLTNLLKFIAVLGLVSFIVIIAIFKFIEFNNHPLSITKSYIYIEPSNSFYLQKHNLFGAKKDWHNYEFIEMEKMRVGPGEQGHPTYVDAGEEGKNKELFDENGYYGLISDKIALNRSVSDIRHPECQKRKYLKELPTVSVVIPFYNDHFSTLLRTVYSVIDRSPPELLKEVILVNDHSTKDFLYKDLERYIEKHLKDKVKLFVLPVRSGLIWARLAGARAASGDVLIFLDSHTEANVNWLPPLLEPIAEDYRTCVCPFIDVIDYKTYAYRTQDEGSRGVFDWHFYYHKIPLRPEDQKNPSDPFPSPIMAGGLFAISAKFFWELGGYDPGLDIWGGEQYELSFKVWLCGGQMFDAPCSRVGHIFRGSMPFPNDRVGIDFLTKNYKRVAEVWMDEYKQYIYDRNPEKYKNVDVGDISYQKYVRQRQHCKPFKYFMDVVAPDMEDRYPPIERPAFAYGTIQSIAKPHLCIDSLGAPRESPLGLFSCAKNKTHPQDTQFFTMRYSRDIAITRSMDCFDSYGVFFIIFRCNNKLYLSELPTVSVVIPFLNDHLSTLMRTVHSVINRSPQHLLKEVILVNDHSSTQALYGDLKEYLSKNFNGLAHVVDLPVRSGLITARIAGAHHATGDVIVFLDSHVEANINWLPPLLEPIAKDYRTCVCPFIDVIDSTTYAYRAQDEGARGVFEWNFLYKRIPIRKGDRKSKSDPFPSPVMAGGLFAISSKFFWELGGYDPGLDIWGGEQYELSFKIWLCGGQMFDAPCSRIGHIYRHSPFANARNGTDYVTKNFKRVAEVWMDEYKEFLYKRNPTRYNKIDVGDISKQLEIKNQLKCKPFKYFLEEVAPDMVEKYPYQEKPVFASGVIESLGLPGKCIDTMGRKKANKVGLFSCAHDKINPHQSQSFELSFFRDIRLKSDSGICLDGGSTLQLVLFSCHQHQGNQMFRYDLDTKQIKLGKSEYICMEAESEGMKIIMERCDVNNELQQWTFGFVNETNLNNWNTYGSKLL
ncbi:unnamed protein product [Diamesa serratosioi]